MLVLTPPIFVFFGFKSQKGMTTVSRVFRFFKVSVVAGVTVLEPLILSGLESNRQGNCSFQLNVWSFFL